MKKRVAMITHEMSLVGGLATMITFLYRTLIQSGRYEPELISLATSASDTASFQLRSPATWLRQPRIERLPWHDLTFTHAGVWGSELEFQRYRPRRKLTELLKGYDLLQFVVGSPPWVCIAERVDRPTLLWTATTTRADRKSQMRNSSRSRRAWSSLMVPLAERYERRALKATDSIFALSEYTRAAIEPIAGAEKVVLAPCGVDINLFRPAARPEGHYILCVARFSDPRKNVRLLLDAYELLEKRVGAAPDLYLIGDPPSEQSRLQLHILGMAKKVHLHGPKQGEELAALYRNASFFVLSSNEEGLGIVILEAMASGLPVVSTACGGPITAVSEGETGLLTPIGDAQALAAAMEKLVRDPALRERMGREGRRVAEKHFSLAAAGKVFLDQYERLLSGQSEWNSG
ncbi:MAG: glycosyltransferase family 4 protein [bacterium]|uniref:Glycosyltransferase family 4 protein n=1 Tax=Candidatus Methylomirabilis tolerans TaxID=3123416 RepID=A0AAJ1EI86_9BACT|nr:glycosyltransferase family 4 protein [Candidatus Methylomirabilis sp.]